MVLFIGPPGSGKSTQAVTAGRLLNLPVVGVDDLIKSNQATFDKIHRSGIAGMEPQTDPVLNRLFLERLEKGDLSRGVILDGYPSTKDHGDYLSDLLKKGVIPVPLVIELQIPDETVLKRTENVPGESRSSVEQRLKDFHREMDMLQLYFPDANLKRVDGTKSVKDVEAAVATLLKQAYGPGK
jgi:adenylate kinase